MKSRSRKFKAEDLDGIIAEFSPSLPDEIISEILSPALKVPDHVFSENGSDISPFATFEESSSAFLLVCKAWLRVGTPLLYNVVVLRSRAQAKALSQVLANNPELGRFVKKLRVEGGFGMPMHTILKFSSNITDIFLSLDITAADVTTGLCEGLPLINPTRVVLRYIRRSVLQNKMLKRLFSTLSECLSNWENLQIVDLPSSLIRHPMTLALQKSANLHMVIIPHARYADASCIALSLKDTSLRTIRIKEPIKDKRTAKYLFFDHLNENPTVSAMLEYTVEDAEKLPRHWTKEKSVRLPSITPSLNPSFVPMDSASESEREYIWKRIIFYAMSIPEREADIYREDLPRRLPLLLVSKTFHKLALPYYYSVVHLKYPSGIPKFRHILLNHPTVGPQVHAIWGSLGQPSAQGQDQMATILSLTTRLEKFHRRQESFHHDTISPYCDSYSEEYIHRNYHEVSILSCSAFQAMAKASGSTLREFSQEVSGARWSHCTVFDHFTQLTSLDWKGRTEFISPELHCNGLRNLTDLRIWYLDPSFLTMLESMKLPSLRRLALSKKVTDASKFLKLCGNILTELDLTLEAVRSLDVNIFALCPNLTALSVHFDCGYRGVNLPHITDFVLDDTKHQHLYKVKFDLAELNSRHINNWDDVLEAFEPTHFPNLREIQVQGCVWPTTEREIAKSIYVRWAERFLENGISMVDRNGRKWRARLKSGRR